MHSARQSLACKYIFHPPLRNLEHFVDILGEQYERLLLGNNVHSAMKERWYSKLPNDNISWIFFVFTIVSVNWLSKNTFVVESNGTAFQ